MIDNYGSIEEHQRMMNGTFPFDKNPEKIILKMLKGVGGSRDPKFSYKTVRFGQANYLLIRCKEENIHATYCCDEVLLYAKRKAIRFLELVKESMKFDDIPFLNIEHESIVYNMGRSILCVMLKKNDTCYTNQDHFSQVVNNIFIRKIPRPKHYMIFRTQKEMIDHLEQEEKIII